MDWSVIETVNWGRLFHAYGVAIDTPGHLRNLISDDDVLREQAVDHLFSAVLHQGTIYSATPAATQVVVGLLHDPMLCKPLDDDVAELLSFLGEVGNSLNGLLFEPDEAETSPSCPSAEELDEFFDHLANDEDGEDDTGWGSPLVGVLMEQALLDLRLMADKVIGAVIPFISATNPAVKREAVNAAGEWGAVQPESEQAKAAFQAIKTALPFAKIRDERADLVLTLGRMGGDVSEYLDDPDEAIQACAALFIPGERADSVLIKALSYPEQVNTWFTHRPAFFPMHVRFTLLSNLISRGVTIEQMLPAALAMIAGSAAMCADNEWGPILQIAFPDAGFKPGVRPPLPDRLTEAQRAVLEALVANELLWDPRNGNASLARMKVGLSDDRDEVLDYIRSTQDCNMVN